MCPNGAKVRLNMGITERRYRNWDAALGHYLRARELAGEGFCEPDYWIGVTRINQGDEVALGAEVRPRCSPAAASLPVPWRCFEETWPGSMRRTSLCGRAQR